MLSAESAIGAYPQKALAVLRAASERMESWSREENMQKLLPQHQLAIALPDRISEQICTSAAEMGIFLIFLFIHPFQISTTFFFR
jgi:pyruvate kinase